jgi:hypothetical protein
MHSGKLVVMNLFILHLLKLNFHFTDRVAQCYVWYEEVKIEEVHFLQFFLL